ncbi:MAG: T9SS type A sorting domain-containing protein [Saprospiraceae bacterium]
MDHKSFRTKIKFKYFIILLFGFSLELQAQKHYDYNWLFGYGTGIPDSSRPFGGVIMSFANKQIRFSAQARVFEFNYQSNSFSDIEGQLLYMSNGCFVADAFGEIIPNGDSIGYGRIWGINCPKYQPVPQAGIFINFSTQKDSLVFLHTILDTIDNGLKVFLKAIYETKIDIKNNIVTSKNKIILYDTLYGGGLTAIQSSDTSKWWVITARNYTNEFYTFLYSNIGVEKILKQKLGLNHISAGSGGAQGVFSPDGKRYAFYSMLNGLQVFDFNRINGELSNYRLYNITFPQNSTGGCGFSPNSRFVYVSNPTEVIQVDLLEQDSSKAIDTVGIFDNFFAPYPATFMQMALGPDCRMYITAGGGNQYLHVITKPNLKGKECMLINRGLKLPTRNSHATTNFPHYRVDDPYPCDSTISIPLNTAVEDEYKFKDSEIMVYPNPASSILFVHDLKRKINLPIRLRLIDLNGKVCFTQQYNSIQEEIKIPIPDLQPGMFIIQIIDQDGNYWIDKFIKE